jgi:hypothetical protein
MLIITDHVNRLQSRNGVAPKADPVLRAFVAAWLLQHHLLGVDTITKATVVSGSSRPSVEAALTILKSEDEQLQARVLTGCISLQDAAARIKRQADLIASYRSTWPADRAAFVRPVGPEAMFDTITAAL